MVAQFLCPQLSQYAAIKMLLLLKGINYISLSWILRILTLKVVLFIADFWGL